jgi:CheY-like chemotaxis protein
MAGALSEQINVLVIDDDEAMRNLLVDIIAKREHQVIAAASAEEALELLPVWTFHIAFIDHNLPGMEGLLLGEYLRRNNPDMTIAMVTGSDDPKVEKRSRALELAFIPKPFAVADILRVVDDYVEAAKEREERRRRGNDPDFEPPIARFVEDIAESYGIPKVPGRIQERLVETLKRSLHNIASAARYTERDRVLALSGLLTARVLNVDLPRSPAGRTLFEEYDELMKARGRRTEFELPTAAE